MTEKYQQEVTTLFGAHVTKITENLSNRIKDGLKDKVLRFKADIDSTDDDTPMEFQRDDIKLYLDLVINYLETTDPLKLMEFLYTRDEFKAELKQK